MTSDSVDAGYPLSIAANWPGLVAVGLAANLNGVVDVYNRAVELWVPDVIVRRAAINGPHYLNLPWRGVLHTTEGPTAAGALSKF